MSDDCDNIDVRLGQQKRHMKDPFNIYKPTLPVAYPQLVLEIVAERGFDPDRIFSQHGLSPDLLQNPSGFITPMQYAQITACAAHIVGDQGLGLEVGLRMRPTAHGFLGYGMLSCHDLYEALLLSLRFMRIRQRHIQCSFQLIGNMGQVTLKEKHSFGPIRHFFIEGLLVGMNRSAEYMVNDKNLPVELWFDYSRPAYFENYQARLPDTRFSQSSIKLMTPLETLQRPLGMADPHASKIAIAQCENELASITNEFDFLYNLKETIRDKISKVPSLESVADNFFVSSRTLKRRLKEEGTTYQKHH
ncbi:MAG: AraC family transcriptional regulator ligand-binding domain-containing protein [Pseudomonadales bacterium]|nr:AraC family transcriptional regulator ligand-binding domain-containing protein [Pseudomonadales bacterium]